MEFAFLTASLLAVVGNVDISIRIQKCGFNVELRIDELCLIKLHKVSFALPVEISWLQRIRILTWDDMVEHITNSIKATVTDVRHLLIKASILVLNQVCREDVATGVVVNVLDVRAKVLIVLVCLVHYPWYDYGITSG
jgi:hypothetical protein